MFTSGIYINQQILSARPARRSLPIDRPQAFFVESEYSARGTLDSVATLLLTNRECPFRCLMCDLWKGTVEDRVPIGAIPQQIRYALERLPTAEHIKLYNSGNFFDAQAIPIEDHAAIADLCRPFRSVIVENHPQLTTDRCLPFRDLLAERGIEFEIAMGLETIHPEVLPRLNKQMSVEDFAKAARFLEREGIRSRAFLLLRPPFLSEEQGVEWALKSLAFAFDSGVDCGSFVPVRAGNGIMDQLASQGDFCPPSLASMEHVLAEGLSWKRGRVFMDLWDAERLSNGSAEAANVIARIRRMNIDQQPALTNPRR